MNSDSSNGSSCRHFIKYRNTKMQKIQNILEVGRWLELPVKFTVGLMPELVGGAVAAVPVGTIILTSSTLKRSQEVSETKMRRRRGLNITIVVDVVGGKSSVLLYKLSLFFRLLLNFDATFDIRSGRDHS